MSNSNPRRWPRASAIASYGIAVLSVATALIIGQLPALHLQAAHVSLFLCAVMVSAWFGGVGPGLLAVFLSVLAFDYYVLPPIYSLALKPDDIPRLAIFALSALFVGSLSAAQRNAAESLRRGRDELEAAGQELKRINEALRAENTGRKQIEGALRRSEAYLTEAQRISSTGSFGWNVSSGDLFWSEESFRIFEYDRTTKPTVELVLQRVHPEDAALVKQTIERASQDGKDFDFEHRLVMPDSSVKHVHVVAHASRDESGSIEFVGAVMDVTAAKQAKDRVREQEIELRQVLDLAPQHVAVVNSDGRCIYLNQAGLDYHGITLEEWRRSDLRRFLHPDDLERLESKTQGKFLGGSPHETEARLQRNDGKYRWFLSRSSPMRDEQGRITRWYVASTDIEDRKQAEEALHKAQAELAHVTRVTTLGEMTASIAHEINQPLAAVVTNGSACLRWLMGESPNLEEAREASRRVIRDGNRASEVIARIRALMQKTEIQKAQLDINEAIQEIVLLTQNEAARKGVRLQLELAGNLPRVFGDRVQLQQVALNLVINGVEAMASVNDRPRELAICSRMHESDQVLVAVQDCGVGIDRENLETIFNAFYTTKSQGMGMGLAISRSIVENHGGRLWAAPNDGPGITFQFTLQTCSGKE